jgi:MoxR-like ATPase
MVFATQNPVEQEGTYPLPEAQVDRFLLKLVVSYPEQEDEQRIVRLVMDETSLPEVDTVLDGDGILQLQEAARHVHVDDRVISYATEIVSATRDPHRVGLDFDGLVELGASPRASIALVQVARARALMEGRDSVLPEHVKAAVPDVLRHRVLTTYRAEAEGVCSDDMVGRILEKVKVP